MLISGYLHCNMNEYACFDLLYIPKTHMNISGYKYKPLQLVQYIAPTLCTVLLAKWRWPSFNFVEGDLFRLSVVINFAITT